MTNTEHILEVLCKYENSTREDILKPLNIAVSFGKSIGLPVDRYRALPEVTGRSKHTVMSWFNRPDKKIPLIDLCVIARYLKLNIYTFLVHDSGIIDSASLLGCNQKCMIKYGTDPTELYIEAYKAHRDLDKDILVDNLEQHFITCEEIWDLDVTEKNKRWELFEEICNCSYFTYKSWFNRSRKNVRVPLDQLCRIAIYLGVDVFSLMV